MVEEEHEERGEAFGVNFPAVSSSAGAVWLDVCTSMGFRPIFLTYVSRSTLSLLGWGSSRENFRGL